MERIFSRSDIPEPVNCQRWTSQKAGNMDFHLHNNYEIFLLVDGSISYFVEHSCYHMNSGDLILFNSQEIHKAINLLDTPFTRLVVHFNPMFIRQFSTSRTNLLTCFHHHGPGMDNMRTLTPEQSGRHQELFRRIEEYSRRTDYGSDLHSIIAMIELLLMVNECFSSSVPKTAGAGHDRIQPIMTYIDEHLTEHLSLETIAKTLSMDKYYLSHLFKKETESSIFQYILVKRVALSKELLSQGFTVTEACQQAGFNDYSNFIRSFKKITGYSPGQFKKSHAAI